MELVQQADRFELRLDGQVCELLYRREGGRVFFTHTLVPAGLRGRGLAAQLVAAGLQWAKAEGLEVVAVCSYVAEFLARRGDQTSQSPVNRGSA